MALKTIDWSSLKLPEYEEVVDTRKRLVAISEKLLAEQGILDKPDSSGFNPSVDQAREVAVMSALGLEPRDIALVLNIDLKRLTRYYTKELSVSANLANAIVARKALQMAMGGKCPDMTKFWLKARAGWKETHVTELTGKDGGAVEISTAKDRLRELVRPSEK